MLALKFNQAFRTLANLCILRGKSVNQMMSCPACAICGQSNHRKTSVKGVSRPSTKHALLKIITSKTQYTIQYRYQEIKAGLNFINYPINICSLIGISHDISSCRSGNLPIVTTYVTGKNRVENRKLPAQIVWN